MTSPLTSLNPNVASSGTTPTASSLSKASTSVGNDAAADLTTQLLNQSSSSGFNSSLVTANPILSYPIATPIISQPVRSGPPSLSVSQLAQPGDYQTNSNEIWASADEVYSSMGKPTPPSVDQRAEVRAILFAVQDAQQSGHSPTINTSVSLLDPSNIAAISAHVTQHMSGDNQAQVGGGKAAYNSNPPAAAAQSMIANVLTAYASRPTMPVKGSLSDDNGRMSNFTPSAGVGWNSQPVQSTYCPPTTGVVADGAGTKWAYLSPQQDLVSSNLSNTLVNNGMFVAKLDTDNFIAAIGDGVANGSIRQPLSVDQAGAVYAAMQPYAQNQHNRPSVSDVATMIQALPAAYCQSVGQYGNSNVGGNGLLQPQLSPQQTTLAVNVTSAAANQGLHVSTIDGANVVAGLNDAAAARQIQGGNLGTLSNALAVYGQMDKYQQAHNQRPDVGDVQTMLSLVQQLSSQGDYNSFSSVFPASMLQNYNVQG